MRVAFLKQELDVFGPWASVNWDVTDADRILDLWPTKAVLWEMTCLLRADWFIVKQILETDYTRDLTATMKMNSSLRRNVRGVLELSELNLDTYDLVVTIDPILMSVDSGSYRGLIAYFMAEHWDRMYLTSLNRPCDGYDLFLAHMMDADFGVHSVPQAVSFPYLRSPDIFREQFTGPREEKAWIDWRMLTTLSMTQLWTEATSRATERLRDYLQYPISFRSDLWKNGYGLSDLPDWNDSRAYLKGLAECKYYLGLGRPAGQEGPGHALCDAASAGCICIGEENKPYHRLVCHPAALCSDISQALSRFKAIEGSTDLQAEIREQQDRNLQHHFLQRPLEMLEEAMAFKRQHSI